MRSTGRSALVAALAIATAACDAAPPVTAPEEVAPQASAGPPGPPNGFATVRVKVHAPSAPRAQGPIVDNFADAVARVSAGGTILVDAGTWDTGDVVIDKSVTIEPARTGERPVIRNTGNVAFDIRSGEAVIFRGLAFEVGANFSAVYAAGAYGAVLVEDCAFLVTTGSAGVFGGQSSTPNAQVTVRNSTFSGGNMGVFFSGAHAETRNNTFDNHSFSGIQYQAASSGTIEGNSATRCGIQGCIRLHTPKGILVAGNIVSNTVGREVRWGIIAFGTASGIGTAAIRDNRVLGSGIVADASDPNTRLFITSAWRAGILIDRLVSATVANNYVAGAHWGIDLFRTGGTVTGNEVENCGSICIDAVKPATAVRIENNLVRANTALRRTLMGFYAEAAPAHAAIQLANNRVLGSVPTDQNVGTTYAFVAGIQAGGWDVRTAVDPRVAGRPIQATGNLVLNVQNGLTAYNGGIMAGTDNTVGAFVGLAAGATSGAPSAHNASQRNDISAVVGLSGSGTFAAKCNWWGSAAGPQRVSAAIPASSYRPVATTPIAGQPAVTCS